MTVSGETFDAAAALHTTPKTHEGAVKLYDDWAYTYDSTLRGWGYEAHLQTVKLVEKWSKETGFTVDSLLDCGCGTGMVAEELAKSGIANKLKIGVDCSPESLVLAAKKAIEFRVIQTEDSKKSLIKPQLVSCGVSWVQDKTFLDMNVATPEELGKNTALPVDVVVDKNAPIPYVVAPEEHQSQDYTTLTFEDGDTTPISKAPAGEEQILLRPIYQKVVVGNLDKPFNCFADGSLDCVMCVGTTSYVTNFQNLFGEWIRLTKKGGLIVFTDRRNLWDNDEMQVRSVATELENAGKWQKLYMSEPSKYMPKNTVPEEAAKQIYYLVYKVL